MTKNEISYIDVWSDCPEKWQTACKDFWLESKALPNDDALETRIKQLCTLAVDGDRLVAVSTVFKAEYKPLRCELYFFRCLVSPEYRRRLIARQLAITSRKTMEAFSAKYPTTSAAGMAVTVESPVYSEMSHRAIWPSGLNLVGYTNQGQQVRVAWFQGALLK
ncbi:MAG: GNAT family N-acetyltransferase [Xanthomonadales bacterium]|nr:GNAT family N-acetyltransferase [Xanthomonadales bacterium]